MTAQYLGNDLYKIWIGHQEFCLSKDEINSIQSFNFTTMKEAKSVEELELKIEKLQQGKEEFENLFINSNREIEDLKDKIEDLKEEILKSDKNFS